jgi:hypothetical protein
VTALRAGLRGRPGWQTPHPPWGSRSGGASRAALPCVPAWPCCVALAPALWLCAACASVLPFLGVGGQRAERHRGLGLLGPPVALVAVIELLAAQPAPFDELVGVGPGVVLESSPAVRTPSRWAPSTSSRMTARSSPSRCRACPATTVSGSPRARYGMLDFRPHRGTFARPTRSTCWETAGRSSAETDRSSRLAISRSRSSSAGAIRAVTTTDGCVFVAMDKYY